MTRLPRLLAALVLLALPLPALASAGPSTLRIDVVVSELGEAAARGRLERRVAEGWARRVRAEGGVFGQPVELAVANDAGDPERALRLVQEATRAGAHAIVCCSTAEATARVAPYAAGVGVPLLSPAGEGHADAAGWQFALAPDWRTELRASIGDAVRRGATAFGLLAPDDAYGRAVGATLAASIAADAGRVVGVELYDPDAEVLTPEALLVATRGPGAVLAWGRGADAALAVHGLRARGWEGPVYVRADALDDVLRLDGAAGEVRVAVPPALLPEAVAPTDPTAGRILDVRELAGGRVGSGAFAVDGALMHDALALLRSGFEQASVYGVAPEEVRTFRLALRDALVSLDDVALAAGRYDPAMDRTDAALPEGLVVARPERGRLAPLPRARRPGAGRGRRPRYARDNDRFP